MAGHERKPAASVRRRAKAAPGDASEVPGEAAGPRSGADAGRIDPVRALRSAVILAVDPGETSGWSVWCGRLVASGVLDTFDQRAVDSLIEHVIGISCVMQHAVLVYERHVVGRHPGASRTIWRKAWGRVAEGHRSRVVTVAVGTWRKAILGNGKLRKEQARAIEQVTARALSLRQDLIPHDEAAAICIGAWATHAPEVAAKLQPRKAKP